MTTRPILFSGDMVRAILAGSKTQTRRKLKFQDWDDAIIKSFPRQKADVPFSVGDVLWVRETWARTTNTAGQPNWPARPHIALPPDLVKRSVIWAADGDWEWCDDDGFRSGKSYWKPSIHMSREFSRLTLCVTDVRVERLQAISEADAIAEGVEAVESERDEHDWSICPKCGGTGLHGALGNALGYMEVDCQECNTHKKRFSHLWNHINGDGAWEANPFVVAISFTVHKCNVDAFVKSEAA
jgi:hypothetical protein